MSVRKILIGCIIMLATLHVDGAMQLKVRDQKDYKQVSYDNFEFLGGEFITAMTDGSFTLSPCSWHGFSFIVGPSIFCRLGLNAYVARVEETTSTNALVDEGDLADTIVNGFYSLSALTGAERVAPFRGSEIELTVAPYGSTLPRPRTGESTDVSVAVTYDYQNQPIQEYTIAQYLSTISYPAGEGGLTQQFDQIVPGQYHYDYPSLFDITGVYGQLVGVDILQMVEFYPGRSKLPDHLNNNFRFYDSGVFVGGKIQIDPSLDSNRFNWRGMVTEHVLASDQIYLSVVNSNYELKQIVIGLDTEGNPTGNNSQNSFVPEDRREIIVYPVYGSLNLAELEVARTLGINEVSGLDTSTDMYFVGAPPSDRSAILLDPYASTYPLPITFRSALDTTQNNQDYNLKIEIRRNTGGTTAISSDRSLRIFRVPIDIIQTAQGAAIDPDNPIGLPPDTPVHLRELDEDPDGDGYSNFAEYAFNTSMQDASDNPSGALDIEIDEEDCPVLTFDGVNPNAGASLIYSFEKSEDGVNWTKIEPESDAAWGWLDGIGDEDTIAKIASSEAVSEHCLFRFTATDNSAALGY